MATGSSCRRDGPPPSQSARTHAPQDIARRLLQRSERWGWVWPSAEVVVVVVAVGRTGVVVHGCETASEEPFRAREEPKQPCTPTLRVVGIGSVPACVRAKWLRSGDFQPCYRRHRPQESVGKPVGFGATAPRARARCGRRGGGTRAGWVESQLQNAGPAAFLGSWTGHAIASGIGAREQTYQSCSGRGSRKTASPLRQRDGVWQAEQAGLRAPHHAGNPVRWRLLRCSWDILAC